MARKTSQHHAPRSDTWHVYPLNDLREHDTSGATCWCRPTEQAEDDWTIVTHHAADNREALEVNPKAKAH